jgi:hypothetical protein
MDMLPVSERAINNLDGCMALKEEMKGDFL